MRKQKGTEWPKTKNELVPWARTAALLIEMCVNDLLSAKHLVDLVRSMWHCDCGILRTKGNRQNGDDVPSFVLARSQAEYITSSSCVALDYARVKS